jgi:hypothetical protein
MKTAVLNPENFKKEVLLSCEADNLAIAPLIGIVGKQFISQLREKNLEISEDNPTPFPISGDKTQCRYVLVFGKTKKHVKLALGKVNIEATGAENSLMKVFGLLTVEGEDELVDAVYLKIIEFAKMMAKNRFNDLKEIARRELALYGKASRFSDGVKKFYGL